MIYYIIYIYCLYTYIWSDICENLSGEKGAQNFQK